MSVRISAPEVSMDAKLRPLRRPFFGLGAYLLFFIWISLQVDSGGRDWHSAFQGAFLLYGLWGLRQAMRERRAGKQSGLVSGAGLLMWIVIAGLAIWGFLGGKRQMSMLFLHLFAQ